MYVATDRQRDSDDNVTTAARVLVVDDDAALRTLIVGYLQQHGIAAVAASGRPEVDRQFATTEPHLVILDLHLEKEDGLDVLRAIRARSDVPVIIVTGQRCEEVDRVVGLELGADHYILKPVSLRELLARVRAALRRWNIGAKLPCRQARRDVLRFVGWVINRRTRRLTDPSGAEVSLTKGEYALLSAFLDAPGRPLTREHLLQATHVHEDVFDRSVDVHILRLRRKLEADPNTPSIIRTERGIGYAFIPKVERA